MIVTLQTLVFFRESLLNALNRLLHPYYKKFAITFGGNNGDVSDDEESEEQVFAEYDDVKGVVFYPPVYIQRYAAVSDCLMDERWCGKLEKVVDIGYHDMSFIKYLKEVPGVNCILGVDIETFPLRCSSDLIGCNDYDHKRENPLQITLFKGNAADPDYRLIGCDAVVAIEMIEHMLPHDLERLIHTVFGFIKPRIAIFTTPNGDFNVLFKSLEKNGLRRLDHFFEWTREQFHDWCSNITLRYPQYTVSCKGIGPGPPGTQHLGCCSQMALFVANEYTKQQDLNLYSLALVANSDSAHSINNLMNSWNGSETPNELNMITPINNLESFSELSSEKQSYLTIMLRTPTCSLESLASTSNILLVDKTSQCNLDSEISRNYLMFDYEQMCLSIVVPRRNIETRVYVIEDVNSRLNCTTSQVTKFTKTTQNLMAKNKLDSLVHTREVVDEIRHLRNMLNFNKDSLKQITGYGDTIWCNINWGDNAPYWNQYYKIVREYHYPFESKSDECRILELISDEIRRLVDAYNDDDITMDINKIEIPIKELMSAVDHLTDDVDKVKELLEWNGYEVYDDVVIYSRMVVDNTSGTQGDWQETDSFSDWDSTDLRSTSTSDGSTNVQDYHARCLRRVLDQKVRKLRSMLTSDADITTELDQVVCRLMKLALHTSKGRQQPPPAKWMQCKLLDLLTLTEKSIERKKRHFVESCPLNALNYGEDTGGMVALKKIKDDDTALKIVDKYLHLVKHSDESQPKYGFIDTELEDDLSLSSTNFVKDYYLGDGRSPSLNETEDNETIDTIKFNIKDLSPKIETSLERTQAWLEDDVDIVSYPDHNDDKYSEHLEKYIAEIPKYEMKYKGNKCSDIKRVLHKKSHYNTVKRNKYEVKYKEKCTKTKVVRKVSSKKIGNYGSGKSIVNKYISVDNKSYVIKPKKNNYKTISPTASKPIPQSLVKLCHPELMVGNVLTPYNVMNSDVFSKKENEKRTTLNYPTPEVAVTKQSMLISIVTEEYEEIVALRRTVGTDAEVDPFTYEEETLIRSISNSAMHDDNFQDKHNVKMENVHSQTIFLYDIDEPTTSKGVRHVSMDVQCGPDTSVPAFSILSATTSLYRMPELCTKEVQIGDATSSNYEAQGADYNRTTETQNDYKTITLRDRSVGIKINDSLSNIPKKTDNYHVVNEIQVEISNCNTSDNNTYDYKQYNDITPIVRLNSITNLDNSDINKPCQFITAMKEHINQNDTNCTNSGVHGTYTKHETVNKSVPMNSIEQHVIINTIDPYNKNFKETTDCGTYCYGPADLDSHLWKEIESFANKIRLCDKSDSSPKLITKEKLLNEYSDSKGDKSLKIFENMQTFVQIPSILVQTNNVPKIILPTAENAISGNNIKPKLGSGGIQVHSYRDQQTSEDVMYQGRWQINRPKVLILKKQNNAITPKKICDSFLKAQSILKENNRQRNIYKSNLYSDPKSLLPISNSQFTHLKQDSSKNKTNKKNSSPAVLTRPNRQFRKVIKVPSKVAISSVSAKNHKTEFVVNEPSSISAPSVAKDNELRSKILNKNYLPLYLRRRLLKSANDANKNNLNVSFDSSELSTGKEKSTKNLVRSKTVEIDRNLLRFQNNAPISKFLILRNEIETKNSSSDKHQAKNSGVKTGNTRKQRQLSPKSGNSSTCSSPNSLATVKAASPRTQNVANRKLSKSSYECSTTNSRLTANNSEPENTLPDGNKKLLRKSKSAKRTTEKVFENKENIPQTSKTQNMKKKSNVFGIDTYMEQKQDVYIANVTQSSQLQINKAVSKNKTQKSNVSTSKAETNNTSVSKRTSFKSDVSSLVKTNINEDSERSQTSNLILDINTQKPECEAGQNQFQSVNVANNDLVENWIDRYREEPVSYIEAIRQLIDEALDLIDYSNSIDNVEIDNETVFLSYENIDQSIEKSGSPISFKTVITNDSDYNELLQRDIEHALNRSIDTVGDESVVSSNGVELTVTDFDMLSFKSVTSTSRFSEYLSADNEFSSSQGKLIPASSNIGSVHDFSERKLLPIQNQNRSSALSNQSLSGFSQDFEPFCVPDPINVFDSETGSMALVENQRVASEELCASGRSTGSFESCLLDEDAVVPNWLFHIISQQQSSIDELEPPVELIVPVPPADDIYDDNGNVVEGAGAGTGAGDGRGIHSDHSQDSSGRGTSISSSEVSSAVQSEGALVDPETGNVVHYESLREDMNNAVAVALNDPSGYPDNGINRQVASDVDADVSSFDADDLADSSDN